ncbi:hypothetical protein ABPG72_003649 [Tetrahymena utriculariae]
MKNIQVEIYNIQSYLTQSAKLFSKYKPYCFPKSDFLIGVRNLKIQFSKSKYQCYPSISEIIYFLQFLKSSPSTSCLNLQYLFQQDILLQIRVFCSNSCTIVYQINLKDKMQRIFLIILFGEIQSEKSKSTKEIHMYKNQQRTQFFLIYILFQNIQRHSKLSSSIFIRVMSLITEYSSFYKRIRSLFFREKKLQKQFKQMIIQILFNGIELQKGKTAQSKDI